MHWLAEYSLCLPDYPPSVCVCICVYICMNVHTFMYMCTCMHIDSWKYFQHFVLRLLAWAWTMAVASFDYSSKLVLSFHPSQPHLTNLENSHCIWSWLPASTSLGTHYDCVNQRPILWMNICESKFIKTRYLFWLTVLRSVSQGPLALLSRSFRQINTTQLLDGQWKEKEKRLFPLPSRHITEIWRSLASLHLLMYPSPPVGDLNSNTWDSGGHSILKPRWCSSIHAFLLDPLKCTDTPRYQNVGSPFLPDIGR